MEQQKNIFDHLKPKQGFTPDASYFDELANSVIQNQKSIAKVIPLYKKPVVWLLATAASIALLLLVNVQPAGEQDVLLALNNISSEEIKNYIEENIDEFDTYLLAEYIAEETLEENQSVVNIEADIPVESSTSIQLDDIDAEDILKYFEDEEIDIYDLDDFWLEDELFI